MRLLLAVHNAYTDYTSGAARSVRTLVGWMREAGHDCRVLSTARFDTICPDPTVEAHLARIGIHAAWSEPPAGCPVGHYELAGVPVTVLNTRHNDPLAPDSAESRQFLRLFDAEISDHRPDLVLTYGGHPVVQAALQRARAAKIATVFALQSLGYETATWLRQVDRVLTGSEFLARHYRAAIGLDTIPIAPPIAWPDVQAPAEARGFVTFVHPSMPKGAGVFARLADSLGRQRPDIPLLVVQSAADASALTGIEGLDLSRYPQILASPPILQPRDIFALTKILLVPSLSPEPVGRVAAEAMINGVPALVSNRGALPQTVAEGALVLDLPDQRVPAEADLQPWFDAVTRLWDDPSDYARASAAARAAAERLYAEPAQRRAYEALLTGAVSASRAPETATADPPRSADAITVRSSIAGIAWPAVTDAISSNLLALQWQLDRSERWPAERLQAEQFRQAGELLAHCAAHVPFWRDRLARAELPGSGPLTWESWRRLPVLTRAEVQAAGTALHADPSPAQHGQVVTDTTSGSSGTPMHYLTTHLSQLFWHGFLLRETLWHGWDPAGRLAVIMGDPSGAAPPPDGREAADWGPPLSRIFPTGPAATLDIRSPIEVQAAWLARQNPDFLLTWPSNLAALAQHCLDHDIRPSRLRVARTLGETVPPSLRDLCRKAWGAELVDCYSAGEVGYIALQCPSGPHYHIQSEGILVEVLDDVGAPCAPGEIGRVVVTSLHNFAMPLLRYEIGDSAELGGRCTCGRTLPTIARVLGRTRDRLILPNGQRRFFSQSEVFTQVPQMRRYQIAQVARDLLEFRVEASGPLPAETEAMLEQAVADTLQHRFRVRFVYFETFPQRPGTTCRDVVCEIEA